MGRPLNTRYFGSTTDAGKQVKITECWIPGEEESNTTSIIIQQMGVATYKVVNTSTEASGIVTLKPEVSDAGDAVIEATLFTKEGNGATAHALMGVTAVSVVSGGVGYDVSDTLSFSTGSGLQAVILTVTSVDGSGAITGLEVTQAGMYGVLTDPEDAVNATSGTGTGATVTATAWEVVRIVVDNGGDGYASNPAVTVSGNATATSSREEGMVDSITVTNAGSGYTSIPTVTITGASIVKAVRMIHTFRLYTFDDVSYVWNENGTVESDSDASIVLA